MTAAHAALVERIETLVVERYFRDLPPMVDAMARRPTVGAARAFVLEWTKFSRQFPRWVGAVISNCPEWDVIAFEIENLYSEVVRDPASDANHYELLVRLGAAVDLSRDEIERHEPTPEASAAFELWWARARDADWLVGFTAVNGLEILGDRTLPRRHGLAPDTGLEVDPWAGLGLAPDALEFFRVGSQADEGHGRETVEIIARHTPAGREEHVLGVLGETIDALRSMMDGLWRLALRHDQATEHERGGAE
ncbi:MAG TPA: iron-containing redox enzyme family protein [Acidimicrobiales bacterium]|nr:iron-containing redox enzyme family protein [Acidimicrobiales bacterium]